MQHIPVFLAANELYAPFIATTMLSILDHTKSFVDFYILTDGISEDSKRKIACIKKLYKNYTIEYLHIDTDKYLSKLPEVSFYSLMTYNRYLIPLLKPNLNKVLYSDVDVIYMDDIQKMYDVDLGKFALAAPIEEIGLPLGDGYDHKTRKEKLKINQNHLYFQAGNIIIDCDYWRKNKIVEKCFETTLKHKDHLLCPDLDVLNILFQNNYKKLDYRFSVCTHRICSEEKNQEMLEAAENPFCIHYASQKKPWSTKGVPLSEHFWYYARQTAFYEDILASYISISQKEQTMKAINALKKYPSLKKKYALHKILSKITFGKLKENQVKKTNKIKIELKKAKSLFK